MKEYQAYLFDWDGTLATTLDTWLKIIKQNYKKYGLFPDDATITADFGDWRAAEKRGLAPEKVDAFVEDLRKLAHNTIQSAPLYPHAKETIAKLRASGKKTALVTSSTRETIDAVLEHHDLVDLFDIVVTGSEVENHKPHPESLAFAMKELGVSKPDSVMIGDSDKDLLAASNAGIDSILFFPDSHQTFHNRTKLEALNPIAVIADLQELVINR